MTTPPTTSQAPDRESRHPCVQTAPSDATVGSYEWIGGECYYRIGNSHLLPPFFSSLVSSGDHWMFIDSGGAMTAGRRNPDSALFPYYSADKLRDLSETSGDKTIIQLKTGGGCRNWEPYSRQGDRFKISRNCYRNEAGSRMILEEINHDLQLLFRCRWSTCDRFGFVRECHLVNLGEEVRPLRILDGFQNILPSGVASEFQLRYSNLADAYKRQELLLPAGIGLFSLGSIPTDRAEPNESLRCTVAWQRGLADPEILLSRQQLDLFREGKSVQTEPATRGVPGHFLTVSEFELRARDAIRWTTVADVEQDASDAIALNEWLNGDHDLERTLIEELEQSDELLNRLVASADGLQVGSRRITTHRHRANTTYNIMRGGVPFDGYQVSTREFAAYLRRRNRVIAAAFHESLGKLPASLSWTALRDWAASQADPDLSRIASEYLPFTFSRRHGDPTRPWNRFSIETRDSDGNLQMSYEGNWRDLFQNWEAVGLAFPKFFPAMILRFANASTLDGHNPYRITQDGFDWERLDPEDPWAHIGYWGDHQIIYLLKLIEEARRFDPDCLDHLLQLRELVFADVPYRLRAYPAVLQDARQTIRYDRASERKTLAREDKIGSDGRLVHCGSTLVRATLMEKLLLAGLTKFANLVPGAGIWLNTQRPEWNDANNALVGHGSSVVTVCHLRRFFAYLGQWLRGMEGDCELAVELASLLEAIEGVDLLWTETPVQQAGPRQKVVEQLQKVLSDYRERVYSRTWEGKTTMRPFSELAEFFDRGTTVLDWTLHANRREDGLVHSYNLMRFERSGIALHRLNEMLEGQVAALESGVLSPAEAVSLLNALRTSQLYRADQRSFLLYPDRQLPGFLEGNRISPEIVGSCPLLASLAEHPNQRILKRDVNGDYHFHSDLHNRRLLDEELDRLRSRCPDLADRIDANRSTLTRFFDTCLGHDRFTGRSGTFFAYEGLGSIYWHMVSKLLVATQEQFLEAAAAGDPAARALRDHYFFIRSGLGGYKTPAEFGAFPADPYSHTPEDGQARQPGMTGQVKEDLVTRFREIGVQILDGTLRFELALFDHEEWLKDDAEFEFVDLAGRKQQRQLRSDEFAFTVCQVPVVYRRAKNPQLIVEYADQPPTRSPELQLSAKDSRSLFNRDGKIIAIRVEFPTGFSDDA